MFKVTFITTTSFGYVVSIDNPPAGLRALDGARAQLGPQIACVSEPLGFFRYEIQCNVTESQARKACSASGAFGYAFGASVVVPREALNQYVRVNWRPLPDAANIAACDYSIDAAQLVEDWLAAGAPLEWTPDGYEPSASPEEAEDTEEETGN
jgi:hypothetical protein